MSIEDRYAHDIQRFRYFMVAGAAACLAYSLTRVDATVGNTLSDYLWLGAVIVWATSFVSGLFGIEKANQTTSANIRFNVAESEGLSNTATIIHTQYNKSRVRAYIFYEIQKWALLVGAALFGLSMVVVRFAQTAA